MFRLTSAADFERVRREGRSHAHPLVVLIARRRVTGPEADGESEALPTRCGIAASKGMGTAVARNRAKRLLREAVRQRAPQLAPGWDLVFVARAPLAKVKLSQAQVAVNNLLRRANVVVSTASREADGSDG
jgi:ribonuclease P protein component